MHKIIKAYTSTPDQLAIEWALIDGVRVVFPPPKELNVIVLESKEQDDGAAGYRFHCSRDDIVILLPPCFEMLLDKNVEDKPNVIL
jgi:hypothetical protein